MVRNRRSLRAVGGLMALVSALLAGACGRASSYPSAAYVHPNSGGPSAPAQTAAGASKAESAEGNADFSDSAASPAPVVSPAAPAGQGAPAREADSSSPSSAARRLAQAPSARPGLGTEWGETRSSYVQERSFDRATPSPSGVAMLYYNDREGARAMTRYADYRDSGYASVVVPGVPVTVSVRDQSGAQLPAYFANGNTYAIGEAGQHYKIVIRNDANFQVEAIASVDGLDVIDGREASYGKRGYIVPAYGSIEVEGFRQSSSAIAAFRFGSVRDSYAARTGSSRNVGVIGLAVFAPRGAAWSDREVERRQNADPFPGRYAAPPPPR